MELQTFTCPNCGKSLEANPELPNIVCNACGTTFVPDMSTAKLAIHKISGIANKVIDNKKEEKLRQEKAAEEHRARGYKELLITFLLLMFMVLLTFLITKF